jgi:hypothetical protein
MPRTKLLLNGPLLVLILGLGCRPWVTETPPPRTQAVARAVVPAASEAQLLDDVERRTFGYFWELAQPENGLVPDRWPTPSFSSVAAGGFGLTALPIGVERGYVSRAEGAARALRAVDFLLRAPQGEAAVGMTGHRGFLYHFLDMQTGERFEQVELSSIDTTLFLAGALFCQSYFDGTSPVEVELRAKVEAFYRRIDWTWLQVRPPLVSMGWHPEKGHHGWDWKGYNEAMLLYVLALGSPTHPIGPEAWKAWTDTYRWDGFYGQEYIVFAQHFGHQYSHVWLDFRGVQDEFVRAKGIDYFENSRRATLAQRAYAIDNPRRFRGYGRNFWGLTASDGPLDGTLTIDGIRRTFHTYWARGAGATGVLDDGTIAPTAAIASLPFAPEVVLPVIRDLRERFGANLYGRYGFLDAVNLTLRQPAQLHHGQVVADIGWFDSDYLGIDQGPILAMIENHRTELVWKTMRRNPYVVAGMKRAGFRGGWLEGAAP